MTINGALKSIAYVVILAVIFFVFSYISPENKAYGLVAVFFSAITVSDKLGINVKEAFLIFVFLYISLFIDASTNTFFYLDPNYGEIFSYTAINSIILTLPIYIAIGIEGLKNLFSNYRITSDGK